MQDGAARRFIDAARLHADEAVLDEIEPADAIVAAEIVERGEQASPATSPCRRCATGSPFLNSISIDGRLVGRVFGRDGALIDIRRRLDPRIFQHFAFRGRVQEIGIDRERRFAALVLGHLDLVLLGEVDEVGAALELPFAPGRDDLDVGIERIGGEFEAHLVIALAGGAMGDGVGAGLGGDLDQALGDQRPRDRGAEQIDAFIERRWRGTSGRRNRGRIPRAHPRYRFP